MSARLFAIPAATVVFGLVGAAMFGNSKVKRPGGSPSTISPGQPNPHGERGLCSSCHLIGGPSAADLAPGRAMTAAAAAQQAMGGGTTLAPAIYPDQARPHGERGPCTLCHTILQAQPQALVGPPTAGVAACLPTATQLAPAPSAALSYAGQGAMAPLLSAPAGGQQSGFASLGPQWGGIAAPRTGPTIVEGMTAPHDWRGQCVACHIVLKAPATGAWQLPSAWLVQGTQPSVGPPAAAQMSGTPPLQLATPQPTFLPAPPPATWMQGPAPQPQATWTPSAVPQAQPTWGQGAVQPQSAQPLPTQASSWPVAGTAPEAMWLPAPAAQWPMAPALQNAPPRNMETEALGMAVRPTTGDVQGMLVVEVEGMARRAGLELGDIIRAVDGQMTASLESFSKAAKGADPTRGVVLDIVRGGKTTVLVVR